MSELSNRLREHGPSFGLSHLCDEAADALDANDARIAALEAQIAPVAPAVDAQPVAIYQTRWAHPETVWGDVTKDVYDGYATFGYAERRIVYPSAQSEGLRKGAERYRRLRDTLQGSKIGGGVEVNDALQYGEKPTPGREACIYWFPDTSVDFYEVSGATLDEAVDALPQHTGEKP